MKSRLFYALLAVIIFGTELAIATGVIKGGWIRANGGDILAVVLVYCALRVLNISPMVAALSSTAIGFGVETSQYFHLADRLGLPRGSVLSIALGNTFSVEDLLMYVIGGGLSYIADMRLFIPIVLKQRSR